MAGSAGSALRCARCTSPSCWPASLRLDAVGPRLPDHSRYPPRSQDEPQAKCELGKRLGHVLYGDSPLPGPIGVIEHAAFAPRIREQVKGGDVDQLGNGEG